MKRSSKISKPVRYVSMIVLVLAFVFAVSIAASPAKAARSVSQTAISNYLVAQSNPALTDQQKIKAAIDAYFTTRYEGQKTLQVQEFAAVVSDANQVWVQKEQDKRDIELYTAKRFDLQYLSYKYTLKYRVIAIKGNAATVSLYENHEVVFKALAPVISTLSNLQHVFTLQNKGGQWSIIQDQYKDELSEQMENMSVEQIKQQVDENYNLYQAPNRHVLDTSEETPQISSITPGLTTATYNRARAVTYADKWANGTNPNYYPRQIIKGESVDCTDFVSQVIYSGMGYNPAYVQDGMSVSTPGWYYTFSTHVGSLQWVNAVDQYNFITRNTLRKGPYGRDTQGALCPLANGDVVQIKYYTSDFGHEGVIVSSPFPSCNNLQLSMYQIDAHDNDRKHYPLSAWAGFPMRFIKINGYRK
ncbi:MAG: amidase domain-containing protein [Anaerolineales bacterium]